MQDLCPDPCALPAVRLYFEDRTRAFCIPGVLCTSSFAFIDACTFTDADGHGGTSSDADSHGGTSSDADSRVSAHGHSGTDAHKEADGRAAFHTGRHGRRLGDRCCLGQP